ncbi:unnamed protein product [Litomosoides sigmodontis]|uniref:Uncharacterized protein n=1 Tax=Litomosoides sigmodontis TaxID=42156 RepID=A0A3P6TTD0_LITSI|nr:unnamed protein product [Litomosoides sigmodontis]
MMQLMTVRRSETYIPAEFDEINVVLLKVADDSDIENKGTRILSITWMGRPFGSVTSEMHFNAKYESDGLTSLLNFFFLPPCTFYDHRSGIRLSIMVYSHV